MPQAQAVLVMLAVVSLGLLVSGAVATECAVSLHDEDLYGPRVGVDSTHRSWGELGQGWEEVAAPAAGAGDEVLNVTLWLKPRDAAALEDMVHAASDPLRPSYAARRAATQQQLRDVIAPAPADVAALMDFVRRHCGHVARRYYFGTAWQLVLPLHAAQVAFQTTFKVATHRESGVTRAVPTSRLRLPAAVGRLVQVVGGMGLPNSGGPWRSGRSSVAARHRHTGASASPAPGAVEAALNMNGDTDSDSQSHFTPYIACFGNEQHTLTCQLPLVCPTGSITTTPCKAAITEVKVSIPGELNGGVFSFSADQVVCQPCAQFPAAIGCKTSVSMYQACAVTVPVRAPLAAWRKPSAVMRFADGTSTVLSAVLYASVYDSPQIATPTYLRRLYDVPANLTVEHGGVQAVIELPPDGESFLRSDLNTFNKVFGVGGVPNMSSTVQVVGADNTTLGGEAALDLQVITGMAPGATTQFIYNPPPLGSDTFWDNLIETLAQVAESPSPPQVLSISYDAFDDSSKVDQVDTQTRTLAAKLVTVLVSSGDTGMKAWGTSCSDLSRPNSMGALPFVTTVGATMQHVVTPGTDPQEIVCSVTNGSVITSGGGFGVRGAMPSYQHAAVAKYVATPGVLPSALSFNTSKRAYPDVAAIGHGYPTIQSGALSLMDGTSASTPLVGAMVTLWNDALAAQGKPPLGFINPLLYYLHSKDAATFFNDITIGSNNCQETYGCCPFGFHAAPGWDAATGLGSPKWTAIRDHIVGYTHT